MVGDKSAFAMFQASRHTAMGPISSQDHNPSPVTNNNPRVNRLSSRLRPILGLIPSLRPNLRPNLRPTRKPPTRRRRRRERKR